MDGNIAANLPQWATYLIAGLSATVTLLGAFVLGLVAFAIKQRGGNSVPRDDLRQGHLADCGGCSLLERLEEKLTSHEAQERTFQSEINANRRSVENLTARIDRILELKGGQ